MTKLMLQIELQPFRVPNYVIAVGNPGKREDGFQEAPKYPLSDLSAETLEQMCREFRAEVFRKADKSPPDYPTANAA